MKYFRSPKTTGERRANQDDGERWEGRRRDLPSAWDDIYIFSRDNRNWKKFRKTKWR